MANSIIKHRNSFPVVCTVVERLLVLPEDEPTSGCKRSIHGAIGSPQKCTVCAKIAKVLYVIETHLHSMQKQFFYHRTILLIQSKLWPVMANSYLSNHWMWSKIWQTLPVSVTGKQNMYTIRKQVLLYMTVTVIDEVLYRLHLQLLYSLN